LKSYFIVSQNHFVNLKTIYENLRLSFWHIIAGTVHVAKKTRASKSSAVGCEFIELGLNVSRGSLDRGVPPSPSNPDTEDKNCIHFTTLFKKRELIDFFTDTAAILNLLDLRSIMGCPGGTRPVFTRAFRAKKELQYTFLGKKAFAITSKDCTTIFFSHYNLFLGKLKEKLARKARVNTDASISDRAHAPWVSLNTP